MPSLGRQGGVQFVVGHPCRGSEECRQRRFPWGCHLAVADHRTAQAPDREPVDHQLIILDGQAAHAAVFAQKLVTRKNYDIERARALALKAAGLSGA